MLRYALPLLIALLGCGVGFDSDETAGATGPGAGGGGMASADGGGGSGGDGASGGAGGMASGGGGDVGCLLSLADDFSSAALDTTKWNNWGPIETGTDVLGISWTGGINEYGGVHSADRHDIRDCAAFLEIATPPTTGNTQAFMYIGADDDNRVGFYLSGGTLHFAMRVGASNSNESVSFDATVHRFWRISESAGKVQWHTSPDAATWSLGREADTPDVSLDNGQLNIGAGTLGATSAGNAAFDNFNTVP